MRACRLCGRLYPDEAGFCQADGQALLDAAEVPVLSDAADHRVGLVWFDRYQIRRVVADGGMGRVYEALDLREPRNVAVKVLHPHVAADAVAVERFKREFEVSRLLPSPYIVQVLDFHPTADGSFALIMEFLYGEELRATLKREKRLSPERAVRMISQIALGMDDAHSKKLVHRDLKPDNIFLCQTADGDISKVLDFGSVKDKGENAKKLTALGTTIGSPYYMSPEQAQGLDSLDHRADVWALAAIFYECITGTVPFHGHNGPSILLEIITKEPVPPSTANGAATQLPPALDEAVLAALRKSVADRTHTVGHFADAVGHSFGLEGSHADWATTNQRLLERELHEKLPQSLATPAISARYADVAAVGADNKSLEARMDAAFAAATPAAALGELGGQDDYTIPTRAVGWVMPAIAAVVLLAVVAALILAR